METKKFCGTCKWHKRAINDWICTNDNSEYCADYTGYNDTCDEWEGR